MSSITLCKMRPDTSQDAARLGHWGRLNKMAPNMQNTFSNAFSSMKNVIFWLKFDLSLSLRVPLANKPALVQIITWCYCRIHFQMHFLWRNVLYFNEFVPQMHHAIAWTNIDPVQWFANVSASLNELTHCGLVTPYGDIDLGQHWVR